MVGVTLIPLKSTYCAGASTLGSGLMLDCFHAQGQSRDDRDNEDKFHTLAITGAKVVQLSIHTQYGMPSGPEAVFLILESANSTSCSLNLGGGRVSQSMERRRTFILDTEQDRGIISFLANVHQCNIAFSVVHVQVCFKPVLIVIIFLTCRLG